MKGKQYDYSLISKHRSFIMGVATLFIGLFHLVLFAPKTLHKVPIVYDIIGTMNVGVEMFLFVSGIGLYFSLAKKPKFTDYYIKRIINVYLVFLLISFPYSYYLNFIKGHGTFLHFLAQGFSLTYWHKEQGEYRLGWYVVYIMILYLIYPFIYKLLNALDKHKSDLVFTVSFSAICIISCILFFKINPEKYNFFEIGITRLPIFMIGCYCGKKVHKKEKIGAAVYPITLFGILLRTAYLMTEDRLLIFNRFSQCFLALSIVIILIFLAEKVNIKFIYKFFALLGTMSLEFYLIHNHLRIVIKDLGYTRIRHYFFMLIVTFVLSYVLSRLRITVLKKRFKEKPRT